MKTPSLEEVKEYFKNAKEVREKSGNAYLLNWDNVYLSEHNNWCLKEGSWVRCYLWNPKNGYAEIISYKEKTYQLSETFVKELCKEPNILEAFVREGIIKPETYVKIPQSLIDNTPNDYNLGGLVRNI
mgnify:CR=1 FL=1